ncbi:MAG: hypothetical protein IKK90_04465 [Bacteroides sp.]|nr:hypothetical protein [Bacteroides sp.]
MKISFVLTLSLVAILMEGCFCTEKNAESDRFFSREDFKETRTLSNPEVIVIEDMLYPASFRIMDDSLLLASNQPVCESLLEIYSLNTLKLIKQLVKKGSGPGEMLSCDLGLHSNQADEFFVRDLSSGTCYVVNWDGLLRQSLFEPSSHFRVSSEVSMGADICLMSNDRYVGCHMWYLEDRDFSNVESPLLNLRRGDDSGKGMGDYPFMVASVNGSLLFIHPETNRLWSLDMHRDMIRIYNDSLKQIASLAGPDNFSPTYTKQAINAPVAFVTFADEKYYTSYIDYYLTDKHVYLVYQGTEHFNPKALLPVEIFKMDFSGNLLCNYKMDRYVYSISLDSSEEYLYCASRTSLEEPPVILKYKL